MKWEVQFHSELSEIQITIQAPGPSEKLSALLDSLTFAERGILTGFTKTEAVILKPERILRFYGEDKEVRAQTIDGIYTVHQRLYELERLLTGRRFVRVSHSEIVNLNCVTALNLRLTGTIQMTLTGGVVTYVSRRYVKKIKEVLGI